MSNSIVSQNGSKVQRISSTQIRLVTKSYVSYTFHAPVGSSKVRCTCSAHTKLGKCSHEVDAAAFRAAEIAAQQPKAQPLSSLDAWIAAEEAHGNILYA